MSQKMMIDMVFHTPQNVKSFCFATSSLPNTIQVKVVQDDSIVDGKSILGVLSLDFTKNVSVNFTSSKPIDKNLLKIFNQWTVGDYYEM